MKNNKREYIHITKKNKLQIKKRTKIMRKKNLELKTTNNQVDTSTQTPIEIALKIDENGMTTASQLYSFLELHPAHFSDWCRRNIKNNKFATKKY